MKAALEGVRMCSKKGRPKGAKTWHETRGVKIAFEYESLRRFGLSKSDALTNIVESWHIEPESVLRSFYRHKMRAEEEVNGLPYLHLAILISKIIDEVLHELPAKLASEIHGKDDERMVRSAMQNVFYGYMPIELKRRTENLSSIAEEQELINGFVDSFCDGLCGINAL